MKSYPISLELPQSKKITKSPTPNYVSGQKMGKLGMSKHQAEIDSTILKTSDAVLEIRLPMKRKASSIVVYPPSIRRKILNVKYFTCKKNVQIKKSSRILDLESISKEEVSPDCLNLFKKIKFRQSPL
eukprot:NODE_144_length_17694_cov_0.489741.p11 type:complete len:128 gc:universal NODE_144_length_17694_cov_0.489741:13333-12950(-)